jgi:glycosyltransferase involved in cell wall biosynthesis
MSRDTPMRDHRSTGPDTEEARWPIVDVVVPALNEQRAITRVLADLPADRVRRVVVVDNASSDATARRAEAAGASVVYEPVRGYGSACLRGIRALAEGGLPPDVVVFVDADYSDHPDELTQLVEPLAAGRADFVVGSRTLGEREPGSLLPQARFGNWLAAWLIRRLYGMRVTDLGPFRAIRWSTLMDLDMADADFGWTAEMQVKAARAGVRYVEVPASYRRRIGASKITGTLSGTLRAGWKILYTVFRGR